MARVSVVIPCYNAEGLIRTAVDSVLGQTFQDLEVLVVDDGSTDASPAIVEGYGDPVRLLRSAHGGPGAARNAGVQHSTGEIIAFLDADDIWEPGYLEHLVSVLDGQPTVDVAYAWARYIDAAGRLLPAALRPRPSADPLSQALTQGCFVLLQMLVIRRSTLERVGLFDPELPPAENWGVAEDWDLLLRLAAAGARFACVPRLLVRKRLHAEGSLSSGVEDVLRVSLRTIEKVALRVPPRYAPLVPQMRSTLFLRAAANHWRLRNGPLAVQRFADALAAWPRAAMEPAVTLGLLLRLLPPGHRTLQAVMEELDVLAQDVLALVREAFACGTGDAARVARPEMVLSTTHAVLAGLFAKRGSWRRGLAHGVHAVRADPRTTLGLVLKSLAGTTRWGRHEEMERPALWGTPA